MIGFAVLAHDDPAMLQRLVGRLSPHPVGIHLDSRVDLREFEAKARISSFPNATYSAERVRVRWGGGSVVDAMSLAGGAVRSRVDETDFIAFLSGHCYPLKPVELFEEHVRRRGKPAIMRVYDMKLLGGWHRERYERAHWFDWELGGLRDYLPPSAFRLARKVRTLLGATRQVPPPGLRCVAGSQWFVVEARLFDYAQSRIKDSAFASFWEGFAPDEMVYQTILHNSPWAEEIGQPENLPHGKISDIPNYHALDPRMTGTVNLDLLDDTSMERAFFVRKVRSDQVNLLNEIDSRATLKGLSD